MLLYFLSPYIPNNLFKSVSKHIFLNTKQEPWHFKIIQIKSD